LRLQKRQITTTIPLVPDDDLFRFKSKSDYLPLFCIAAVMAAAASVELVQGRIFWCRASDLIPWAWDVWSPHNSQHLIDPYSFTHILHGVVEFWLLGLLFRRVPLIWRLVMAVAIEGSWEIVENTSYVINRYREATISLDYFGDSILNSLSDIVCCGTGFVIASKLRFWWSLALFVLVETILIFTIRDSLIINVIMLIYPIDALRKWQFGG
jgi:Protein of unknown function (DUF2585)